MSLQEFYEDLQAAYQTGGFRLVLDENLCGGAFRGLYFSVGALVIEDGSIALLGETVTITGNCVLNGWNDGALFQVRIVCRENEGTIVYQALFWNRFFGTLQELFGNVSDTLIMEKEGGHHWERLAGELSVSMPQFSFDSQGEDVQFPLAFSAEVGAAFQEAFQKQNRQEIQITGNRISGRVSSDGAFELELPVQQIDVGIFPTVSAFLLLRNGMEYGEEIGHWTISQVGVRLSLLLPQIGETDVTFPLFTAGEKRTLHMEASEGIGIVNLAEFFAEVFSLEKSVLGLQLPENTPLDRFRLYQMDLLTERSETSWKLPYLAARFALDEAWKLPIPHVTLEELSVWFQLSFGKSEQWKHFLTASATGRVAITLGNYRLELLAQLQLPDLYFTAQAKLFQAQNSNSPGLAELADTFQVSLPKQWHTEKNLLGEISIGGSGKERDLWLEAGVYDILSFSLGGWEIRMSELTANVQISPSAFGFSVMGIMAFGEGKTAFSIYLKAKYDKIWEFSGGLYQGTVSIGSLLAQMFGQSVPEDIVKLALTELDVNYRQSGEWRVTAAFEAGWNLAVLGKQFLLGGRLIAQRSEEKTDVSALSYLNIDSFSVLAQIDHIQSETQREYLFRIAYQNAYLQAAWSRRSGDELLSVSLGGMTLGALVESLAKLANPNKRFQLPSPWNLLNKIELSRFLLEWNITQSSLLFFYRAELEIAGLMYLDRIGVRYEMKNRKLFWVLTGKLLGISYGEDAPLEWDALDGKPPENSAEDERRFDLSYLGLGQHLKTGNIADGGIAEAIASLKEQLRDPSWETAAYDPAVNWLFGADFTVNDMVNVRLVLNDPVLYGLLVTVQAKAGSPLEAFNGLEIELLCKRAGADVYLFRGELKVPEKYRRFSLGVLSLTLGTICLEVYTNGGFYLDLGFPHGLDFSRSFVLEWSIFTGRGGFYLGVFKGIERPELPATERGIFSPVLTLGIGLSIGLGRSFDLGIVKGGVSLEVFGILEGVLAIFHDKEDGSESTYYCVKAAAGICGRLYLSVDFKIITVQASAEVSASAMLSIAAYRAAVITVDLALTVQASIKILFVKIHFSFSFSYTAAFTLGSDEPAPWDQRLTEQKNGKSKREKTALLAVRAGNEKIELELLPLFYRKLDSLENKDGGSYGMALLMMMDGNAQKQWCNLLTEWLLSYIEGETVSSEQAEIFASFSELTYEQLEKFLQQNVSVSFRLHWIEEEKQLRSLLEEEAERYVFPMLPPLCAVFRQKEQEQSVCYWKDREVDGSYFEQLTEYFRRLDPDPARMEDEEQSQEKLPIAKAFFLDYFQMFLKELSGRLQGMFQSLETENGWEPEAFGLSPEELLSENPELLLKPSAALVFPTLAYRVGSGDTLQKIMERFGYTEAKEQFWDSVRQETFLLEQGAQILYGEGVFDNTASKLTLKEAAAMLFVRFYEELAPEDMFLAGDIARMNEIELSFEADGTKEVFLTLPVRSGEYRALRGDTPQRLGQFLRLLTLEETLLPEWDAFYADICRRNAQEAKIPEKVHFYAENITVREENLDRLAARLFPDSAQTELPPELLWKAPVLKINAGLVLKNAVCPFPEQETVTVSQLAGSVPCTMAELAAALNREALEEGQTLRVSAAEQIPKAYMKARLLAEAQDIGAMLSRFLLQGQRVPAPDGGGKTAEPELVPLYQALQQMFPLGELQTDPVLTVTCGEPDCAWIDTHEVQTVLKAEEIRKRLPDGKFTKMPHEFVQMEDFEACDRYFSLSGSSPLFGSDGALTLLHWIPEEAAAVLHTQKTAPKLLDENGRETEAVFGCFLSLEIGKSGVDGMFAVYGADASKRRLLHTLIALENVKIRIFYQTSKTAKGGENFQESAWDGCFLAKTNLSKETRMYPVQGKQAAETQFLAKPEDTAEFLRLLWECSTVGGGGYYLRLMTKEGRTLPEDIFDENGRGLLGLFVEGAQFEALYTCVNACISAYTGGKTSITLVTDTPEQKVMQPRFPAGCVGFVSEMEAVPEEGGTLLQSMYQIVGYHIKKTEDGTIGESPTSAPIVPAGDDTTWRYCPVVPVYRYAAGQTPEEENPYLAVGQKGKIVLELRDVLGNSVEAAESEMIPYYNDVLIGIGSLPDITVTYAVTGQPEQPLLRLSLQENQSEFSEEAKAYRRQAFLQLMCADIEVTVTSPVNAQSFALSQIETAGKTYLEQLRAFVKPEDACGKTLVLDFPLDKEQYPVYSERIFELKTVVAIRRMAELAAAPEAAGTVSVIAPYFPQKNSAKENGKEEGGEVSLLPFCRELQRVFPELLLAQTAEQNGWIYGISCGQGRYMQLPEVSLYRYPDWNKEQLQAPEYYALCPLYHGFLSRTANVCGLSELVWDEEPHAIQMPDIDMEIWADDFLSDMERLLLPEQVQKAVGICGFEPVNRLIHVKELLAAAIAEQIMPLRKGAPSAKITLKQQVQDRLSRSLTEGYHADVAACCRLSFSAKNRCRLSASAQSDMPDVAITVGKADTESDEIVFFFNRRFSGKSIPFALDLTFSELEYDIEEDNGYESSRWLRLAEPLRLAAETAGDSRFLESQVQLPNPLKSCPSAPSLNAHTCRLQAFEQTADGRMGWQYRLLGQCRYREQDTFWISVSFSEWEPVAFHAPRQDLFDLLAEHSLYREELFATLEKGNGEEYQKAYESMVSLGERIAQAWPEWLAAPNRRPLRRAVNEELVYSCTSEGIWEADGIRFQVTSSEEGKRFLEAFGLPEPTMKAVGIHAAGENSGDGKLEFEFLMEGLPIFSCAKAKPDVHIVRNQNLLVRQDKPQETACPVREEFLYRTQEVSLPPLYVSGEYTEEYPVAALRIEGGTLTVSDMEQAAAAVLRTLQLDGANVVAGVSVSYYYGLSQGRFQPRVLLPVTLTLPAGMTEQGIEPYAKRLGANLFDWYENMQPVLNCSGLLFDVKIYDTSGSRVLLHFANLKVEFHTDGSNDGLSG